MRRVLFSGLAALLLASQLPAQAAGLDAATRAALDAELAAITNDPQRPLASMTTLVIRQGEVVYQGANGYRYLDLVNPAASKPANPDTLFRIASISKLVTSVGVMKLVEEGKLDLDADVSRYLGYALRNPNFPDAPISLRMLMSHTSSLRDDADYNFPYKMRLQDILVPGGAHYGKGAMRARDKGPGYFTYVNLNWGVIGTIMERVTGERFDRLMQRLVLGPLGIAGGYNAAAFSPAELANLATLYRKRVEVDGKEVWRPDGPWVPQTEDYSVSPPAQRAGADYEIGSNGTVFGPQGSLRISATGLGRLAQMFFNRGVAEGKVFLQPASVDAMFAAQWRYDGSNGSNYRGVNNAWGLGVHITTNTSGPASGDRQVEDGGFVGSGHTGDAWGLTSAFMLDLKKKDALIFMIGGPSFNPATTPGKYSGKWRYEEQILDALYRRALKDR